MDKFWGINNKENSSSKRVNLDDQWAKGGGSIARWNFRFLHGVSGPVEDRSVGIVGGMDGRMIGGVGSMESGWGRWADSR